LVYYCYQGTTYLIYTEREVMKMVTKAYALIDVEAGEVESAAIALDSKPGISAAEVTLGPHDVVAVVEAADAEAVAKMVLNEIAAVQGVIRTTTCLVVSGKSREG
jgi:DNA-binding Lrp family transcriptional regulator